MKKKSFYRGKGCQRCNHTGYIGRIGVLEALPIDDKIRDMIATGGSLDDIRKYGASQGMQTIREGAIENFANGVTTLEEVLRITTEE